MIIHATKNTMNNKTLKNTKIEFNKLGTRLCHNTKCHNDYEIYSKK